jgi:hypothetical protein
MTDGETRRCIGSARFGIAPHDAPINEFPAQPSQKDGLGRMCITHWRAYTGGLARDAKARKAAAQAQPETSARAASPAEPEAKAEPTPKRRRAKTEAAEAHPA